MSSRQARAARHWRLWRQTHAPRARPTTSPDSHGPLRSGPVGPKSPTIGVPDRRGEVQRAGVAGHHQRCAPRAARAGRRSAVGGETRGAPPARRDDRVGEPLFAGPQITMRQAGTSPRSAASAPNRSAGQRLFGHAAPGLISATDAPAGRSRLRERVDAAPREWQAMASGRAR